MASKKCPDCGRDFVRRVSRAGLAETLLSLVHIYPFKCQLCGHRFRSFQQGVYYLGVENDRREYDRMEVKFPVTFSNEGVTGEGMLIIISMDGCSFSTSAELDVGAIVKLRLQISGAVPPVTVDAAVVRNVQTGNAGVEFLRWQETERERLQHFIKGLLIGRGAESRPSALSH
jgi:hypothetical protein